MVIRKRLRSVLIPLVLYGVSSAVVGYFVVHAHSGARGLEARQSFEAEIAELKGELADLKERRGEWETRIALMRAQSVDRDILEELAREELGFVHPNDVVVMLPAQKH
ncbi:septum formation initiator family protein [Chelatococcus daeguensis]|uniref:Septation inhibitor protein n=2 Tax=Chelatococcus TaxID=28209 RepID=A0AAC9JP29_9HYPH|nr:MULTISPECIES: septum formation initiator family protein [Chelatococcus]APF37518.1 septation inhibitor protein [Chelatococcus daeguensis]KZE35452.1 septation inhibitor protein [Chelatococcus daeguensis]MBM3085442.1 septum formation initiator family protein [Chelatococcus daeguensis]